MNMLQWIKRAPLFGVLCFAWLTGCAVVKPYDREALANPIMELEEGLSKQSSEEKLHSTTEGSIGGEGGLSGGCGCSK